MQLLGLDEPLYETFKQQMNFPMSFEPALVQMAGFLSWFPYRRRDFDGKSHNMLLTNYLGVFLLLQMLER